jgi:guanylate kinase
MKKVYVAQAYGGLEENEKKAHEIVGKLNEVYPHITFISPVLAFGDCYSHMDYEAGLMKSFELLEQCDEVLTLDGWEESKGATREKAHAEEKGIPVVTQDEYPTEQNSIMICLLGYQASGKDTLAKLCERFIGVNRCISDTTRPARPGEGPNDHSFLDERDFDYFMKHGHYLETSQTGKYWYGLHEDQIEEGVNIFVCDPNGFDNLKKNFNGEVKSVFIGADKFDRMMRRVARELEDSKRFAEMLPDYSIRNNNLKRAYFKLRDYIKEVNNEEI